MRPKACAADALGQLAGFHAELCGGGGPVSRVGMSEPPGFELPQQPTQGASRQLTTQVRGSYALEGEIAQTLCVTLEAQQGLWAGRGALMAYEDGVDWHLRIPGAAVSRMLSGEGLSLTYVQSRRSGARVHLSASEMGKVAVWDLAWGPVTCTSGAFLAAVGDVRIDVTVAKRIGAALFGGAGLLLQKISGRGLVFLHGAGDFVERELYAGQRLSVSSGHLAAFGPEVSYDVVGVGGCLRSLFGGEGFFMTQMTGPGRVLLQTVRRARKGSESKRS